MASVKTITGKVVDPGGVAVGGRLIMAQLSTDTTIPGTQETPASTVQTYSAPDGTWSLQLYANNDLTPTGSFYYLFEGTKAPQTMVVPQSAGPFVASNLFGAIPALTPGPGHVSTLTVDGQANFTAGPVIIGADPGGGQLLRVGGSGHFSGALTLDSTLGVAGAATVGGQLVVNAGGAQISGDVFLNAVGGGIAIRDPGIAAVGGAIRIQLSGGTEKWAVGMRDSGGGLSDTLQFSFLGGVWNTRASLTSAGILSIFNSLQPFTDAFADLGTGALRFRDAWLSRNLTVSAGGSSSFGGRLSAIHNGAGSGSLAAVMLGDGLFGGGAGSYSNGTGSILGINTATGNAAYFADWQINGVSKWSVLPTGAVTQASSLTVTAGGVRSDGGFASGASPVASTGIVLAGDHTPFTSIAFRDLNGTPFSNWDMGIGVGGPTGLNFYNRTTTKTMVSLSDTGASIEAGITQTLAGVAKWQMLVDSTFGANGWRLRDSAAAIDRIAAANSNGHIYMQPTSGNVGIGISNASAPTALLDVNGTTRLRSLSAFASGDKYVIADANGNLHLSALGPAS